jgi:hypothetical protein
MKETVLTVLEALSVGGLLVSLYILLAALG